MEEISKEQILEFAHKEFPGQDVNIPKVVHPGRNTHG